MMFRSDARALLLEIEADWHLYDRYHDLVRVYITEGILFTSESEEYTERMTHYLQVQGEIGRSIRLERINWTHIICAIAVNMRDDFMDTMESNTSEILHDLELHYKSLYP